MVLSGKIKPSSKSRISRTITIRISKELHDELIKARTIHKLSINTIALVAIIKHLSKLQEK